MSTSTTLRTIVARIEALPAETSAEFITAASRVLYELRKLDVAASVSTEPTPVLTLSAVRRTYIALLNRVAQSPHATLGQRLASVRHHAELTAFEAADACGVALDVIVGVEAGLPVPEDAAAALQGLVDQLDQVTAVA